jgi:hypothetical protein
MNDAHDRYAKIKVSFRLQKMEEHVGAVILAIKEQGGRASYR